METPKARRRFVPEPVETSHRSSRKQVEVDGAAAGRQANLLSHERLSPPEDTSKRPARRKFAPQLIETASRSRKAGDTGPAMLPGDKTNISPGDLPKAAKVRPSPTPLPPANTPNTSSLEIPQTKPAPARQSSIKPHYTTRANTRQHSYRVPSLPSIDSSESEGSDAPSFDASRHTEDSDTSDEAYKDATRLRESVDERFSGYLLALAAKQAEKQLREQEAAAFPNTDYHEPVAHYMNRSDSDEQVSEPTVNAKGRAERARRDSGEEREALKEMRQHGEKVYNRNQGRRTGQFNVEFDDTQPFKQDIWQKAGGQFGGPQPGPKQLIGGRQQDPGLKQMRKAASPPMLGGDIDFPRCPSPDHARFDVTQGADYLRKNVCYLSEQSETMDTKGMWCKPQQAKKPASPAPKQGGWLASTSQKPSQSKSPQRKPAGGLWGGHCNAEENQQMHQINTGLVTPLATPRNEPEDPFAALYKPGGIANNKSSYTNLSSMGNGPAPPRPKSPNAAAHARNPSQNGGRAPPSPPHSRNSPPNSFLQPPASDLDERLVIETRIATEFSDAFVTQVFNYLSLGYPSLAWKFDDELSRISKVPVEELREDDKLAEVRGYVRLGSDEVDTVEMGVEEDMCKRWRALRRYVHEWGRQMLKQEMKTGVGTFGGDPHRAWGLPARRGSWGL